jgi:hypothetical protein
MRVRANQVPCAPDDFRRRLAREGGDQQVFGLNAALDEMRGTIDNHACLSAAWPGDAQNRPVMAHDDGKLRGGAGCLIVDVHRLIPFQVIDRPVPFTAISTTMRQIPDHDR